MPSLHLIRSGLLIGFFATFLMDVWFVVLWRFFEQPRFSVVPMGRWFGYVLRGRFAHADIGASPPLPSETWLGWMFHYGVGMLYGVVLALLVGPAWLAHPTFWPAWILAIATVAAGWFILQPGLGLGVAAAKTSQPNKVRALNLAAHTVFGIGLWVGALLIR